jgi:hypothetical protein
MRDYDKEDDRRRLWEEDDRGARGVKQPTVNTCEYL